MNKEQNNNKTELSLIDVLPTMEDFQDLLLKALINKKRDDAVTNGKAKYARRQELYTHICAYLPRELGEQLRAQLKKDNVAIVDFVKTAAQIYLQNANRQEG